MVIITINTYYLSNINYSTKIYINSIILFTGYFLGAVGAYCNFYILLLSTMLIGVSAAFGEVAILGFLDLVPKVYMGSFVGGTGASGITGAVFYLITHSLLNLHDSYIFILLIPSALMYFICFFIIQKYTKHEVITKIESRSKSNSLMPLHSIPFPPISENRGIRNENNITENSSSEIVVEEIENGLNKKPQLKQAILGNKLKSIAQAPNIHFNLENIREQTKNEAFMKAFPYLLVFFIVYFTDYGTNTGFADRIGTNIQHSELDKNFMRNNFYVLGQFLAQMGIFIGRNSSYVLHLHKPYYFMLVNIIIYCLMLSISLCCWNINPIFMLVLITLSGLMNGWIYLFCINLLIDNIQIYYYNKSFIMNYLMFAGDLGAVFSLAATLIFDTTFMRISL